MRDGKHTVSKLMSIGKHILRHRHVLPVVDSTLTVLQVEGTFATGTHLVTVDQPVSTEDGDIKLSLYGSFLPIPSDGLFPSYAETEYEALKMPGAISPGEGKIELKPGRKRTRLRVTNKRNRPIQIGSHFHFIKSNPELNFDRIKAYGYHLDIPSGMSSTFEPGELKIVTLPISAASKQSRAEAALRLGQSMHRTRIPFSNASKKKASGIGQAAGRVDNASADLILVNTLVIDWRGIFNADIESRAA
ncbi:Urease, beta subunit [Aspergillus californicus]